MTFKELLIQARAGDQSAVENLLIMYQPLLLKESIVDGVLDEDLYQELCITFLQCIRKFSP
ncbi:MAG: helix-turn-helix domain-containing protein [Clostridia bacterium]|nr:helix-turn-helix domain-containing protein [Clostridia bacterium]